MLRLGHKPSSGKKNKVKSLHESKKEKNEKTGVSTPNRTHKNHKNAKIEDIGTRFWLYFFLFTFYFIYRYVQTKYKDW